MRRHVITEREPNGLISEYYRFIRTSLDHLNMNKSYQVYQITSTIPKEGKTTTCVNLANICSKAKRKVLIIDLDLHKPKVHRHFNVSNHHGIAGYMMEDTPLDDVIIHATEYLDVINAGKGVPFPDEVLLSEKLHNLLEELKLRYDAIFIDSPPVREVVDAQIISRLADATIYIIAQRTTNQYQAKLCLSMLEQTGGNIIGSIFTRNKDSMFDKALYQYEDDEGETKVIKREFSLKALLPFKG